MIKNKILIVEDDPEAARYLKEYLQECEFEIEVFETVTDGISHIKFNHYSLILLDINLPDYDGFEVLKFINKHNINIPVIVVSAYSAREYKIQAFRLGASDYVSKPIDPEELELRIWVHLKNQTQFESLHNALFYIQGNSIYFKSRFLKLTKIEFNILSHLIDYRGKTVKREELLKYLSSKSQNDRSLDYHMRNIRHKIQDNGSNPIYLHTEYGVGYKLIF